MWSKGSNFFMIHQQDYIQGVITDKAIIWTEYQFQSHNMGSKTSHPFWQMRMMMKTLQRKTTWRLYKANKTSLLYTLS
jgi:hypothetical protein